MTPSEGLKNQLLLLKDPAIAGTVSRFTIADVAERALAEIYRLRERIEQLEYMEARSAAGAKAERERAEFWKAETEKRAELLGRLEWAGVDGSGGVVCPDCGWERHDPDEIKRMVADGIRIHDPCCDLARLKTMPEEPKP